MSHVTVIMALQFYNTLTGKKEPFVPLHPPKVGVYVCGITAWDATHLGHGRAAVVFDTVVRFLRHKGFVVTFARNYTDVDDKLIARAHAEGTPWQAIAAKYIAEYAAEMAALGNLPPDIEPRASAHIPQMIAAIRRLIDRKMAYVMDGNVFYHVRAFAEYGKLSGKKIEELESGARVDPHEAKRDPLDFALWKASKPGEPTWESPWGPGRPGWHIECSAMSTHYLGQPFDIHGGGRDLIFPHHENEIAQSEGATGTPFVRCWMHNGSLTINDEKMSKSVGNIFQTGEAIKRFDVEGLRYFLLSNHYRSPLDFTEQAIGDCQQALDRVYETMTRLGAGESGVTGPAPKGRGAADEAMRAAMEGLRAKVADALDDDLNTPRVFSAVFDVVREINRYLDAASGETPVRRWLQSAWHAERAHLHALLGLFGSDPAAYRERRARLAVAARGVDTVAVARLVAARNAARAARDFAQSDALRKQLADLGVELKDRPDGTTEWKVK